VRQVLFAAAVLFTGSFLVASPGKSRRSANPPAYAAFSKPLKKPEQYHHALNRLTFGPKPGDDEAIRRVGLNRWLDDELHPERVSENPALQSHLLPLQSLPMGIRETYLHYPPPQLIAAVARSQEEPPDDPELRDLVLRLAQRYLQRKEGQAASNDLSDLDLKVKLSSVLTPDQIAVLQSGKPDEKVQLLAAIPLEKRLDFVWALRPPERQRLFALAPVELRRELMLSVAPQNVVASDLSEGKLLRAVYSTHQLQELLVDFWYNHFNVFLNKGGDRYMVPAYEREAIRPHVFGKFYDLLLATAQSPAMLFYLDNWQSAAPGTAKRGLNENYGRELLELHTLGVDGGYTQRDVIEVARCFTGWTIARPRQGGGFEYNDKIHDKGRKVVLGHVIPAGGGMDDGLRVLDILAHHPATAHFISLKLARRFVADDPPPSLVARMAKTFEKSDGDLRQVLRVMMTSPEFWSQGAYNAKIKMPFEMVASALRATNADISSAFVLSQELQKLGEPLYRKIEPTGYSSANAEWVNSAGLLERMNFALLLAHNRVPGVKVDLSKWQPQNPSEQTRAAVQKMLADPELQKQLASHAKAGPPQIPGLIAGLTLGSPEFQHR
jgi:uncharacterized protein (DUF1800 family)